MGYGMTRREAAALAAAGLGALAVPKAFAGEAKEGRAIAAAPQDKKLEGVLRSLDAADGNIQDIRSNWADPPDPDKPLISALLTKISVDCGSIQAAAQDLLARLSAPPR